MPTLGFQLESESDEQDVHSDCQGASIREEPPASTLDKAQNL
jgi:hypothetical protein